MKSAFWMLSPFGFTTRTDITHRDIFLTLLREGLQRFVSSYPKPEKGFEKEGQIGERWVTFGAERLPGGEVQIHRIPEPIPLPRLGKQNDG